LSAGTVGSRSRDLDLQVTRKIFLSANVNARGRDGTVMSDRERSGALGSVKYPSDISEGRPRKVDENDRIHEVIR
jgi:hypothetical protein